MLFKTERPEERCIKRTFRTFFRWFLKERYVRYIIRDGKMTNKQAYISYKNNVISQMLEMEEDSDTPGS